MIGRYTILYGMTLGCGKAGQPSRASHLPQVSCSHSKCRRCRPSASSAGSRCSRWRGSWPREQRGTRTASAAPSVTPSSRKSPRHRAYKISRAIALSSLLTLRSLRRHFANLRLCIFPLNPSVRLSFHAIQATKSEKNMNIPKTASLDPSREKTYSISVFSSRYANYDLYSMNSSPFCLFLTSLHYLFYHTPLHFLSVSCTTHTTTSPYPPTRHFTSS